MALLSSRHSQWVIDMACKRVMVLGLVSLLLSATAMAGGNGWDYASGDEQPFAGSRQSNSPTVKFNFSSDESLPTVSVESKKSYDSTGNLSIDNDLQQEAERCNRIRSQVRGNDAYKLNC